MYKVLVIVEVRNFEAFEKFAAKAAAIMANYGGVVVNAFEAFRLDDGSGEEIHLAEFPDADRFERYRQDPRLRALADLRTEAIAATQIKQGLHEKFYR